MAWESPQAGVRERVGLSLATKMQFPGLLEQSLHVDQSQDHPRRMHVQSIPQWHGQAGRTGVQVPLGNMVL